MKKIQICIVLLMALSTVSRAQQNVKTELTKAFQFSQQALEAAERSADHLRFFEGAYDDTEIKEHFLFAREDLDSTYFYVKNSSYKCADAAYFARKTSNEKVAERAETEQKQFKNVAAKFDQIIKKIDAYIVHGTYNRDAYITQFIQDFNETYRLLGKAHNHLQQTRMMLESKPVD